MAKTKIVRIHSTDGNSSMQVEVIKNKITVNKRGFCPVYDTWLTEMNPQRVKEWYRIPKGLGFSRSI